MGDGAGWAAVEAAKVARALQSLKVVRSLDLHEECGRKALLTTLRHSLMVDGMPEDVRYIHTKHTHTYILHARYKHTRI